MCDTPACRCVCRDKPLEVIKAEALRAAIANILPVGDDRLPGDRVITFYIRMDELRALRHLAFAKTSGEAR
jgi:hypothetical protein